jgi:type III pantothenate kinase
MLLVLDIGNTQIFGGVFEGDTIRLRFRKTSKDRPSSDEYGLFFRSVLRENGLEPHQVHRIVISSVVPELNYSITGACLKYFDVRPLFLQAGVKTGLKVRTQNPQEVGSDLIANAIAATTRYPDQNVLVVDCGTANTFSAISKSREYLGVAIVPGLKLAMESLQQGTAKLPTVEIKSVDFTIGKNTQEAIQSGLYWQSIGMIREMIVQLKKNEFQGQPLKVVGTGGLGILLEPAGVFDVYEPDLILLGLKRVFELNQEYHEGHEVRGDLEDMKG